MTALTIRATTPDDAPIIHRFIIELATYEQEPHAVEATPVSLEAQLSADPAPFECVIAELDRQPIGFALFFPSYSTWRGRPGLYLEDLYIAPEYRGEGHGAALLAHLAGVAVERGCARLDWQVLDWNTPAIDFYEAIGAEMKRDWIPCRLSGEALTGLAASG